MSLTILKNIQEQYPHPFLVLLRKIIVPLLQIRFDISNSKVKYIFLISIWAIMAGVNIVLLAGL